MNEKIIWDYLVRYVENQIGVAAIMGNLMAESSLNPKCVTGTKDADYISKSDAGTIDFIHDKHAFGLVQWCYWTRKEKLYKYAKSRNQSLGELNMQLDHMVNELRNDFPVTWKMMCEATDIRSASDSFMLRYEKPANTSEAMKQRRARYGQQFYDQFATKSSEKSDTIPEKKDEKPMSKTVVITTDKVNLRAGNDKKFSAISKANKNATYEWVATAENGWHAIKLKDRVAWVSGEFSKVK